jgi:dTDP-4-amino-4,6-dideoxygalactose transaminase
VLSVQLERVEAITQARRIVWQHYYEGMAPLEARGLVVRPGLEPQAEINGHIYAFRVDPSRRDGLLAYLKQRHIEATFHFVPLHSSPYAQKHLGCRPGDLPITERLANSLIRLPLYPHLSVEEVAYILEMVECGLTMRN